MLLRYLTALVGSDAEDIASETWLQITRDLAKFDGDAEGFRGWAATIARHRAMDHLRAVRRRIQPVADVQAMVDLVAGEDTANEAIRAMSTDAAVAMIASLPRDQAESVMLRVVMGLSAEAAGAVLGKRAGAVRTSAHRGLRRLAERLSVDRVLGASEAIRAADPGHPPQRRGVTDSGQGPLGSSR